MRGRSGTVNITMRLPAIDQDGGIVGQGAGGLADDELCIRASTFSSTWQCGMRVTDQRIIHVKAAATRPNVPCAMRSAVDM